MIRYIPLVLASLVCGAANSQQPAVAKVLYGNWICQIDGKTQRSVYYGANGIFVFSADAGGGDLAFIAGPVTFDGPSSFRVERNRQNC